MVLGPAQVPLDGLGQGAGGDDHSAVTQRKGAEQSQAATRIASGLGENHSQHRRHEGKRAWTEADAE